MPRNRVPLGNHKVASPSAFEIQYIVQWNIKAEQDERAPQPEVRPCIERYDSNGHFWLLRYINKMLKLAGHDVSYPAP